MSEELKISKSKIWQLAAACLVILLLISIYTNGFKGKITEIGENKAKEKVLNFLDLILKEKNKGKITNVNEESGLYRITISLDAQVFNAYLSKDGKLFFPSAIDLEKVNKDILTNDINLNSSKNLSV